MSELDRLDPFGINRGGFIAAATFFLITMGIVIAKGGSIVDVVAMSAGAIAAANLAFTVAIPAFIVSTMLFMFRGREGGQKQVIESKGDGSRRHFWVTSRNRQTPVYESEGMNYEVAVLMSGGASRNQIVGMGLSGTDYNKFSRWLKARGVDGEYQIVRD